MLTVFDIAACKDVDHDQECSITLLHSASASYVYFAICSLKRTVFVAVGLMWSRPRNSSEQRSGFSQFLPAATAAVL